MGTGAEFDADLPWAEKMRAMHDWITNKLTPSSKRGIPSSVPQILEMLGGKGLGQVGGAAVDLVPTKAAQLAMPPGFYPHEGDFSPGRAAEGMKDALDSHDFHTKRQGNLDPNDFVPANPYNTKGPSTPRVSPMNERGGFAGNELDDWLQTHKDAPPDVLAAGKRFWDADNDVHQAQRDAVAQMSMEPSQYKDIAQLHKQNINAADMSRREAGINFNQVMQNNRNNEQARFAHDSLQSRVNRRRADHQQDLGLKAGKMGLDPEDVMDPLWPDGHSVTNPEWEFNQKNKMKNALDNVEF